MLTVNITNCNLSCDLGNFNETLEDLCDNNIMVVISNCNITATSATDDAIGDLEKNLYRTHFSANRIVEHQIEPISKKFIRINDRELNIGGDEESMASFIANMITLVN